MLDFQGNDVTEHKEAYANDRRSLVLAWAIGSTSNSNTITLVNSNRLIGNGVGQQDRVSAAELAIKRAQDAGHGHRLKGAVAYSDSFFPFPDGAQKLIDEGVSAILTSSGSVKDEEVFETITEAGVSLYTVPDSAGRGFYAH
jgi:phosphoribosylaminoimidazolecarboxamide formyltransferase/IMP cyclohydrolase